MMERNYKHVAASKVSISELMLPSHANFSGKIHGGYLLNLLDQIAFASACKFSGFYCVTASVDTVDFLRPIEVGELVTLKASVNYVGKSSMIVGIRVEAENIRTGAVKHCNSSYFTMVAKNEDGSTATVPGLILVSRQEVRRFHKALKQISHKQEYGRHEQVFDFDAPETLSLLDSHAVRVELA